MATVCFLIVSVVLYAAHPRQEEGRPFSGHFYCKGTDVNIYLNLYERNLKAPGFDFLGEVNGYMAGNGIYGTWLLTRYEVKGNKAMLRFSNDIGSDAQDVEFVQINDSTYTYKALKGNALRKAVGRKLVKVVGDMTFLRK